MKKVILLCSAAALLMGGSTYYFTKAPALGSFALESPKQESGRTKAQNAKDAMDWRMDRLKDENGNYSPAYLAQAITQATQLKQQHTSRGGLNMQWEELGPDNVGGRTRAILIDKRDASNNTVYAGGVSGGMWKSTDGAITWHRLPNWNQWLTISCITQGPDNTIYIGTGEGLSNCCPGTSLNSGSAGDGIFKLDANDNPVQVTPEVYNNNNYAPNNPWVCVNRIAVNPTDPNSILAATWQGLYQSTDAGGTWAQVSIPGIPGGQSSSDVKWGSDGITVYATAAGNAKLVMSPNGGFSWNKLSNINNSGFPSLQGRIEIAIAPSDPNRVYISVATGSGCTYGVFKTDSASVPTASWQRIGSQGPLFDPFATGECQGWYDNTIAVSPADKNKVYLGGVDFYTWSDQAGWKLADAGLGSSPVNPHYIHPDKHTIVISSNNPDLMYVGCDGGIYKSEDASTNFPFPSFKVSNRGYNVTQNYSVAAGLAGEVLGGAQDNGTNYIDYSGNTQMAGEMVIGGDGIFTAASHLDTRIYFGGIYFGEVLRSGNHCASFDGFYDIKIDPQGYNQPSGCNGQKDANAPFITPFYLSETKNASNGLKTVPFVSDSNYNAGDVVNVQSSTAKYPFQYTLTQAVNKGDTIQVKDPIRSRIFITSYCGVWVTSDALDLSIIPRWYKLTNGMVGQANSYASTSDADRIYIGTSSGYVYRCDHLNALCDTTTYPTGSSNNVGIICSSNSNYFYVAVAGGRSIEGIAVDPNDKDHVVATVAGYSSSGAPHVYESKDGGHTWSPLTNGLPNMPVYGVVIHDSNTFIIASELGIWSWDGTQWNEENNGFPRMPVYRIIETNLYNDGCPVIYLGTHGRGMWRSTTLTPAECQTAVGTGVNNVKANAISGINVFPNPAKGSTKVSLHIDNPDKVTLRVFDLSGKLCKQVSYSGTVSGENVFELELSGLSSGNYLLAATVGVNRTESRLFTVIK